MSRATVSACIIARDEESRLPACLESVEFCDEVIVVDSGSRDATRELARAAGAKMVENAWPGFGAQRNVAIDHATGDWILEVDADERISPELRADIERFLADPPEGVSMGGLPCRDVFLGGLLGPSAKYPKYRQRLFLRGAYRHDEERTVHEGLGMSGRAWALRGDLIHILADSAREAVIDAARYARLDAAQAPRPASARPYLVGVVARPPVKLAYRLVVDGGWRDGPRGLAKIALDCATDALVWLFVLRDRRHDTSTAHDVAHFAQPERPSGLVRVIAIAAGADHAARARTWLDGLVEAGGDGALVTDAPVPEHGCVQVRRLEGSGPLAIARALDAEVQLCQFDAILVAGARERRLMSLVPRATRGTAPLVELSASPAETERTVRESAR